MNCAEYTRRHLHLLDSPHYFKMYFIIFSSSEKNKSQIHIYLNVHTAVLMVLCYFLPSKVHKRSDQETIKKETFLRL